MYLNILLDQVGRVEECGGTGDRTGICLGKFSRVIYLRRLLIDKKNER